MNLLKVIEDLVYDKGLDKESVLSIVLQGIKAAYAAKYPSLNISVSPKSNLDNDKFFDVFVVKTVVDDVTNESSEISFKKAKSDFPKAKVGQEVLVPLKDSLGRVDIIVAKDFISDSIKKLEQNSVYEAFKDRVGELVSGTIHKKEAAGYVISLGDVEAFLPNSNVGFLQDGRSSTPIKAAIKEVFSYSNKGYQIVLDRTSAQYIAKIFALEIPEIFEGLVEIVKAERICGYKTKIAVRSRSKNIDPVGSCVGVAGSRIKPILAEMGQERIDLVLWTDDFEMNLKNALKPGEINKFLASPDKSLVEVWVDEDQKSLVIGKSGGNIGLASRLLGASIKIRQDDTIA